MIFSFNIKIVIFCDGTNNLNGPVELIEVDEGELMRIQNEQGMY